MTDRTKTRLRATLATAAVAAPAPAFADVPMFLVLALTRVTYWWTIPFVLIIEAVALRYIFRIDDWTEALWLSVKVNAISALAGVFVYPMVGMALYPALYPVVTETFGFGPYVEASATFFAMGIVDGVIEVIALTLLLTRPSLAQGLLVGLMNLATVGFMFGAILYAAIPPSLPEEQAQAILSSYSREIALADRILSEAPAHAHFDRRHRFDEDWIEPLRDEARDLSYWRLMISGPQLQGGIVSPVYKPNYHSIDLVGTAMIDGYRISLYRRDWRDGGWEYYRVEKSLTVDGRTFTVNADFR